MILVGWECSPRLQRLSTDPSAPWGDIGPREGQHMPRSLPMGQAELDLPSDSSGMQATGRHAAKVMAVTFPRRSCRMQIDSPGSFCQH
jgi:hypothetical protein